VAGGHATDSGTVRPLTAARPTLLLITGLPGSGKSSLATVAAGELGCAVLGHDWTMAGLRAFPEVWTSLEELDAVTFRSVGWSIMWNLARAQLREGRSIVLDGVARAPEVHGSREVAQESGARFLLAVTEIGDEVHRARIEGRRRDIPHWDELEWEPVRHSRAGWEPLPGADVVLDACAPIDTNAAALRALLHAGAP
jgi:predicted kinase